MYEWGDLRVFLAVARQGSTLSAARLLGVNQTTVARRIAALEAALGVRLFDRRQDGYRPSEAGATLLGQAERVELEAETVARLVARQNRNLAGVIRVTTTEGLANVVITPWLGEFMEIYPDIRVEVIATERRLDLARGEADVAIRAQKAPSDPGIVFRRLAASPWALYCSQAYATRRGKPDSVELLNEHLVIGADGPMAHLEQLVWLASAAPRATVRHVCSSLVNMVAAIKAGHGVGPLPCAMAVVEPDLVECFEPPDFGYHFYLITPEALKDLPRVRAFNDFVIARSIALRHVIEGRPRRG